MLGIAMNILSDEGQMCRWFGEAAKPSRALGDLFEDAVVAGGMVNSHHSVSM